ncbi:hypothetical protein E0L36_09000 [Streptomyces sp. AJS327]|uniref:winged helix-turn-helix domain-containing protein n=1 Tax=Streptomyces sp. AJS327 TaxID=2545265 RepID=UPI0015E0539C|nr:winged helix-turn-helix domain-containing protein [Streptomyces sp. AJS327]MBA0051027.1 hypothetical protein [Streptomyces sp. AJS327]
MASGAMVAESGVALRARAVTGLTAGREPEVLAGELGVPPELVAGWWEEWERRAEVRRPSGSGAHRQGSAQLLSGDEQAAVRRVLAHHAPGDFGWRGALWTRDLVTELLAGLCSVRLTPQTVGRYLSRWGVRGERPDLAPSAAAGDQLARWRELVWPSIRATAAAQGASVLFLRVTPVLPEAGAARGDRPGCALSVLNPVGTMWFAAYEHRFSGLVWTDFAGRLTAEFSLGAHVVAAQSGVYGSKRTRAWLVRNADRLTVHYLPDGGAARRR